MRTTVNLDDDLLRQAKQLAAATGRTLNAVVEDAVRQALARSGGEPKPPAAEVTTFQGNGLQPGVDLDDSAAVLDVMKSGG